MICGGYPGNSISIAGLICQLQDILNVTGIRTKRSEKLERSIDANSNIY